MLLVSSLQLCSQKHSRQCEQSTLSDKRSLNVAADKSLPGENILVYFMTSGEKTKHLALEG